MTYRPTFAQAQSIQRRFRAPWHKPMREFLATQGPYVKSAWVIDAWITQYPDFMSTSSKLMRQQAVGRIMGDLLQKYTSERDAGRKNGNVFINPYTQKQGISVADVSAEC